MMVLAMLISAAVPAEAGSDAIVWRYLRCLVEEARPPAEEGGVWDTMPPAEHKRPLVAEFGRVIEFCEPERNIAIARLREIVKSRHPDWTETKVGESAELVVGRLEVDMLKKRVAPMSTTHGSILDY